MWRGGSSGVVRAPHLVLCVVDLDIQAVAEELEKQLARDHNRLVVRPAGPVLEASDEKDGLRP